MTVIVVVPDWLAAGVTVTVRLELEPPKTMFESGTNAVFDELPVSWRLAASVSASPMIKGIGGVEPFCEIAWSGISEIDGLCYATGHYRNGILLAPTTGELIAEMIVSHQVASLIAPFSPDRFHVLSSTQ